MEQLYPHNREALTKVRAALSKGDRAAVVHATGTGKSFITAALTQDYDRVLILAPNDYILDELRKRNIRAELHTYTWLLTQESLPSGLDLIVLDEFHRTGAKVWGARVRDLLDINPQAKLFGTTATEIRYLDEGRNMADELFRGNVVSRIDLPEAWARGILQVPVYVIGLLDVGTVITKLERKINTNLRLTQQEHTDALKQLRKGTLRWNDTHGIPAILKRHLPKDIKRMIVFCSDIETITPLQQQFTAWMTEAGFRSTPYTIHSLFSGSMKEMESFRKDEGDSAVKVLFAVDMLNEGIHVPSVDVVVMLRCTGSRIIQLQQMGRCMNTGSDRQPVILDLVDNLTRTSEIDILREQYDNRLAISLGTTSEPSVVKVFNVYDHVSDLRETIASLKALRPYTTQEWLREAEEWINANRRRPIYNKTDRMEARVAMFLNRYKDMPEVAAFRNAVSQKYGFTFPSRPKTQPYEERITMLRTFIEREGRWPVHNAADEEEDSLRTFVTRALYQKPDIFKPFVDEMNGKYGITLSIRSNRRQDKDVFARQLEAFVREKGRWPSYKGDETERILARDATAFRHHPSIEAVILMAEKEYGIPPIEVRSKFEETMNLVRTFIRNNGRWPAYDGDKDELRLYHFLVGHRDDVRITHLRRECAKTAGGDLSYRIRPRLDIEEEKKALTEFVLANRRWPVYGGCDDPQEKHLASFARKRKMDPDIAALRKRTEDEFGVSFYAPHNAGESLPRLKAFLTEHKIWPRKYAADADERYLYNFIRSLRVSDKKTYAEMDEYLFSLTGRRIAKPRTLEEHISELKRFTQANGRWPSIAKGDDPKLVKWAQNHSHEPEVKLIRNTYKP